MKKRKEKSMSDDSRQLQKDIERVLNDADRFLSNLNGQKHLKKVFKKDIRHLREHTLKLIERLRNIEKKHAH